MVKLLLVRNEYFNKNNDLKTVARFDGKTLRDASSKIILSADAEVGIVVMAFVAELI